MRHTILLASLLTACSGSDARFGTIELSASAPRLSVSGTTFGEAAALELAPGCPGYLDPERPGHVVRVREPLEVTFRVASSRAPLALAVAHGDEVRCDSDEGSGHEPMLTFSGAGDYLVYVAALREPAELPYELRVTAGNATVEDLPVGPNRDVNVTITSEPSGATVREEGGTVVGTTPAMFVLTVPTEELGRERAWTIELAGHRPATVRGSVTEGAIVLHAQLPTTEPTEVDVTARGPQPLRDYQAAALGVEVGEDCTIREAEVAIDVQHGFVGDLRVVLKTPWGAEQELQRHEGARRRNLVRTWRGAELASLVGHSTRGRWELWVHDDAGGDTGTFERFDLRLSCGPQAADPDAPMVPNTPPDTPRPVTPVPVNPRLPDLPPRTEIVRVLSALRPRVERCASGGGDVRVYLTVVQSGRVTNVSTSGSATATEQACVGRAMRSARFAPFRRPSVDVDYTYALPSNPTPLPGGGQIVQPW